MEEKSIPVLGPSDAERRLDLLPEARGQPVQHAPVAHHGVLLLL